MDRTQDMRPDDRRDERYDSKTMDGEIKADATDIASHRRHDEDATAGDLVGEGVGGVSGAVAGAALGSLAGPVGTVIGGIAGAVSGWWAGRAVSEAASSFTHDEDQHYRGHYESSPTRLSDRDYEIVRPAYQLGHVARHNPEYSGRSFTEIEEDLRKGWDSSVAPAHGEWTTIRHYAQEAYTRNRGSTHEKRDVPAARTFSAHTPVPGGGLTSDPTNL